MIDKFKIQPQQFFPICGFYKINSNIKTVSKLVKQQKEKLSAIMLRMEEKYDISNTTVEDILSDDTIAKSFKEEAIAYAVISCKIDVDSLGNYLSSCDDKYKNSTQYKKMLCAYDYAKYWDEDISLLDKESEK